MAAPAPAALPIAPGQAIPPGPGQEVPSLAPMIEQVTPAVVNIATEGHIQLHLNPLFNDPFFRRFFGIPDNQQLEQKTASLGSGVIVDAEKGLILTNNHVVANADQIFAKLRDGRKLQAKLIGTDPGTDVALIQIKGERLKALPLADSDKLRVGDFVVAIGNPFGLGQTVTSGIISALARSGLGITGYEDYIQTDASINPGNSGGALVNLRGELVGINTAIFSKTGGNIGIGFAIPINMAKRIMDQLAKYGDVKRGSLGALLQDLDPQLAEAFNLGGQKGAVLVNILPGSPAEKAGLKSGDVVLLVNGKPVAGAAELRNIVGLMRVGDKATLDIARESERKQVTVTVAEKPPEPSPEEGAAEGGKAAHPLLAGATFGDIEEGEAAGSGVVILSVERGSPAWTSGLRPRDIVVAVNRRPLKSVEELTAIASRNTRQLLLQIRRGNANLLIVLR
jgi:serine protease Do/serine protease DegQ